MATRLEDRFGGAQGLMGIKHVFTSSKSDTADGTLLQPSNWNADHVMVGDGERVIVGTASGTGATPITITKPGGVVAGDLLLFVGSFVNSVPNVAGPDGGGWTQVLHFDTSSSEYHIAWWKIATASEASSWSITHSSGSDTVAAVVAYRGPQTIYSYGYSQDTLVAPPVICSWTSIQVCVWYAMTAGTDFGNPSHIARDIFVRNTGSSNTPQVQVSSRLTTGEVAPAFTATGGSTNTSYQGALTLIFHSYPNLDFTVDAVLT